MPAPGAPAPAAPLAAADPPLHGAVNAVNDFLGVSVRIGGVTLNLGSLLIAIVVVLIAVFVSSVLRTGLARYGQRHHANQSTLYALSRVLHYVVLTIGVLWALSIAGIPLTELTLFAGALGVGLGFGLQAIFSNFVSGLIILFDRSLAVGDFVELANGVHGQVRDIHIRATRVTTNDNVDVLVPNSKFITDNVVNLTLRENRSRRMHIAFRVPYGSDKEQVRAAALEAAAEVSFTLSGESSREPQVWLTGFGESAMEFALVVWLNAAAARRYRGVIAAYNWALHNALERYHLALPFPQRDLHVKSWLGLSGRDARASLHERTGGNAPATPPAGTNPAPSDDAAPAPNDAARSLTRDIAEDARGTAPEPPSSPRPQGSRTHGEHD